MSLPHFALFMVFCLTNGLNYVVAKIAVDVIPPFFMLSLRFTLLLLLLIPFLKWKGWPHARQLMLVALVTGVLNFGIGHVGIKLANASVAAMVSQLNLPLAVILSVVWLHEPVGWRRWSGVFLTFAGVMTIGFDPALIDYKVGVLLMVCTAFFNAIGQILLRKLRGIGVLEMQAWTAAVAVPLLVMGSLTFESGQIEAVKAHPWLLLGVIVYSAIFVSLIGHGLRFYIIQRYDVAVVSTFTVFAPILGVVFGILLLNEPITLQIVFGFVLVISGVLIISRRQAKMAPEAASVAARDGPLSVSETNLAEPPGAAGASKPRMQDD